MAISDSIAELATDISNAYDSIDDKGGTLPQNKNTNNLATAIDSIQTGITPSGTINITENGPFDVTQYETADVRVAGEEPWITIREFTIDEPAKVDFNTDSEGNPFTVRKLRIHIYNPTTPMPHARINTFIDGCQNTYFYSYFQTSRVEYYVIEISEKIGNLCKFNFMQTDHNPELYKLVGSGNVWSASIRYREKIQSVRFNANDENFPTGTMIKVEGVI